MSPVGTLFVINWVVNMALMLCVYKRGFSAGVLSLFRSAYVTHEDRTYKLQEQVKP